MITGAAQRRALLVMACALVVAPLGHPATAGADAGYVPGQVLVRFEPGVEPTTRSAVRAGVGASVSDALPVRGLQLLELPSRTPVADAVAELERDPRVAYAEPNRRRALQVVPGDQLFGQLWGLDNAAQVVTFSGGSQSGTADADIDAPEAWELSTGSESVIVAVGDSGVATGHPDLSANIDPRGFDFLDSDADPNDPGFGHGTRVAGVIGAVGNNGVGVAGVAWRVRLLPLRLGNQALTSAAAVESFAYAAARGARVYNGSFGSPLATRAELDAITAAADTLFVFAAGNAGRSSDTTADYPCALPSPNVICVAASDQNDRLAPFSNYGPVSVDLAAPGQHVWSTVPGGYAPADGTSFAAPFVSGAAALYLARYPGATVADTRRALLAGVDVKPGLGALATGGRLNARRTLDVGPAAPVSTAAAAPIAPGPAASPRSTPAGRLSVRRRQSLAEVGRDGLRAKVSCAGRCTVVARVTLDRRTARRLRLPVVVARATVRLSKAGTRTLTLRLAREPRSRLARLRGRRLQISTVTTLPGGGRSVLTRPIALER